MNDTKRCLDHGLQLCEVCALRATVAMQRGLLQEAAAKFREQPEVRVRASYAMNTLRRIEAELAEQVRT